MGQFSCIKPAGTCWRDTFVFNDLNRNGVLDLSDSVDLIQETGTKGKDGVVRDLSLRSVRTNSVRQFLSGSAGFYTAISPLVRLTRYLGPTIPARIRIGNIWNYLGWQERKWEEAVRAIPIVD